MQRGKKERERDTRREITLNYIYILNYWTTVWNINCIRLRANSPCEWASLKRFFKGRGQRSRSQREQMLTFRRWCVGAHLLIVKKYRWMHVTCTICWQCVYVRVCWQRTVGRWKRRIYIDVVLQTSNSLLLYDVLRVLTLHCNVMSVWLASSHKHAFLRRRAGFRGWLDIGWYQKSKVREAIFAIFLLQRGLGRFPDLGFHGQRAKFNSFSGLILGSHASCFGLSVLHWRGRQERWWLTGWRCAMMMISNSKGFIWDTRRGAI